MLFHLLIGLLLCLRETHDDGLTEQGIVWVQFDLYNMNCDECKEIVSAWSREVKTGHHPLESGER